MNKKRGKQNKQSTKNVKNSVFKFAKLPCNYQLGEYEKIFFPKWVLNIWGYNIFLMLFVSLGMLLILAVSLIAIIHGYKLRFDYKSSRPTSVPGDIVFVGGIQIKSNLRDYKAWLDSRELTIIKKDEVQGINVLKDQQDLSKSQDLSKTIEIKFGHFETIPVGNYTLNVKTRDWGVLQKKLFVEKGLVYKDYMYIPRKIGIKKDLLEVAENASVKLLSTGDLVVCTQKDLIQNKSSNKLSSKIADKPLVKLEIFAPGLSRFINRFSYSKYIEYTGKYAQSICNDIKNIDNQQDIGLYNKYLFIKAQDGVKVYNFNNDKVTESVLGKTQLLGLFQDNKDNKSSKITDLLDKVRIINVDDGIVVVPVLDVGKKMPLVYFFPMVEKNVDSTKFMKIKSNGYLSFVDDSMFSFVPYQTTSTGTVYKMYILANKGLTLKDMVYIPMHNVVYVGFLDNHDSLLIIDAQGGVKVLTGSTILEKELYSKLLFDAQLANSDYIPAFGLEYVGDSAHKYQDRVKSMHFNADFMNMYNFFEKYQYMFIALQKDVGITHNVILNIDNDICYKDLDMGFQSEYQIACIDTQFFRLDVPTGVYKIQLADKMQYVGKHYNLYTFINKNHVLLTDVSQQMRFKYEFTDADVLGIYKHFVILRNKDRKGVLQIVSL